MEEAEAEASLDDALPLAELEPSTITPEATAADDAEASAAGAGPGAGDGAGAGAGAITT